MLRRSLWSANWPRLIMTWVPSRSTPNPRVSGCKPYKTLYRYTLGSERIMGIVEGVAHFYPSVYIPEFWQCVKWLICSSAHLGVREIVCRLIKWWLSDSVVVYLHTNQMWLTFIIQGVPSRTMKTVLTIIIIVQHVCWSCTGGAAAECCFYGEIQSQYKSQCLCT